MRPVLVRGAAYAGVALALALAVAGLSACASGGGISGTSLVIGPISAFGSIVVNGIEFDTTSAVVSVEGDPAEITDLRLGMFVFVSGHVDSNTATGVADRVAADHLVQGPVEGINVADGTFSALGQLVITDAVTVFDQTTLETLEAGDLVEVFGFLDADGSIRATRVEKKDKVDEFELTGIIAALDELNETFKIGNLTVDFSHAIIEAPNGLANGLLVEVETISEPFNDEVRATGVEVRDSTFEQVDAATIEGFVTSIVSPSEFVLNGSHHVQITDQTTFENGDRNDVVLNAHVDAGGRLDKQRRLIASEIEFISVPNAQ